MTGTKLLVIAGVILLSVAGLHAGPPELTILKTQTPPVINGKLDDNVWQKAAKINDFVDAQGKRFLKVLRIRKFMCAMTIKPLYRIPLFRPRPSES